MGLCRERLGSEAKVRDEDSNSLITSRARRPCTPLPPAEVVLRLDGGTERPLAGRGAALLRARWERRGSTPRRGRDDDHGERNVPAVRLPGATAAANSSCSFPLRCAGRLVYTASGTTPSFTITH